jgi:hypothetical protein
MMIENEGNPMIKEESTAGDMPIPPVAQTVMLRIVSFILGKASLLLLVPVIIITNSVVISQGTIFSSAMLMPLFLFVVFLVFYFRYRKKVLLDFEKGMKSVRFDLTNAKVINIGLEKKDSGANLKK